MKQIVILSGKGGTGKTVLSASFAVLAQNKVMADCDVDAANLYLLLHPEIQENHSFSGGKRPIIDPQKCTHCGECVDACRFSALNESEDGDIIIDPFSCEGCSVCFHICPVEAIEMEKNISGEWFVSRTPHGPFVHAKLGIGEENSGKLVTEVRKKAKKLAEENSLNFVIIDGPPGIGCPVIASLSGTDLALIVTEPTLAGIHDMERVVQTAQHFKIPSACCINKFDINPENSEKIKDWCQKNSIPLVGKIPFDEDVIHSMVNLIPLPMYSQNAASREIKAIWRNIKKLI